MKSTIKFEGPGPFDPPVVQTTAVDGHLNNGVTVILKCVIPGRDGYPEAVNVLMASKVAHELAVPLLRAFNVSKGMMPR
jgi:hypothetical protein